MSGRNETVNPSAAPARLARRKAGAYAGERPRAGALCVRSTQGVKSRPQEFNPTMSIDSTISAGLPRIIVPKRHVDDRGWFSETFHEQRLREIGITCRFVQDNQSSSKRAGTLRGLHFQRSAGGPGQAGQRVARARSSMSRWMCGAARPPSVSMFRQNCRPNPATSFTFRLALRMASSPSRTTSLVMYKVSDYYAPAHDGGIRWNDPDIAIPWPIKDADIIISDKDRRLPLLQGFRQSVCL